MILVASKKEILDAKSRSLKSSDSRRKTMDPNVEAKAQSRKRKATDTPTAGSSGSKTKSTKRRSIGA